MFSKMDRLVTARLHSRISGACDMPMEPNRTRQVIQELAKAFNKLASELTADLSYAAREIEGLRSEVQRLRNSSSKNNRSNPTPKRSTTRAKSSSSSHKSTGSKSGSAHKAPNSPESNKPAHETSSFVFPQEPFSPSPPPEPSGVPGNN
jgi:Mg-chelatase subunit ChlI